MADSIDLSDYSYNDLITLQDEIAEELKSRGQNSPITSGVYVVGKDIKAGIYSLTCLTIDDKSYNGRLIIHSYEDESQYNKHKTDSSLYDWIQGSKVLFEMNIDQTVTMKLEDGEILVVKYGKALCVPEAKPSWAP